MIHVHVFRHYCPGTPVILVGMKRDLRQSATENSSSPSLVPEDVPKQVAKAVGKIFTRNTHAQWASRQEYMHLRHGRPSCVCACQLITFLIVMDTYIRTDIRMYVHHENKSLIQSLALMHSAIKALKF